MPGNPADNQEFTVAYLSVYVDYHEGALRALVLQPCGVRSWGRHSPGFLDVQG